MRRLVAVPVYNEKMFIPGVLNSIRAYHSCDILMVNDGSTDGSGEVIESLREQIRLVHMVHQRNLGYGQSLIHSFRYAIENGYDQLVTIDCDEQHEPRHIPALFEAMTGVDVCSCSRYLRESDSNDAPPPDRRTINEKITRIINRVTRYNLTDSFCGMKGYRVEALKPLDLHEAGYAFPLEFWVQAFHFGLTVKEYPINRIYKSRTRSFGMGLDDPEKRFAYYLAVLEKELERWSISLPSDLIPTI